MGKIGKSISHAVQQVAKPIEKTVHTVEHSGAASFRGIGKSIKSLGSGAKKWTGSSLVKGVEGLAKSATEVLAASHGVGPGLVQRDQNANPQMVGGGPVSIPTGGGYSPVVMIAGATVLAGGLWFVLKKRR